MSRHPVLTYTGCRIICEKLRRKKNGDQANHLGTPQNYLGTPLWVPTPGLGTTVLLHYRYILAPIPLYFYLLPMGALFPTTDVLQEMCCRAVKPNIKQTGCSVLYQGLRPINIDMEY